MVWAGFPEDVGFCYFTQSAAGGAENEELFEGQIRKDFAENVLAQRLHSLLSEICQNVGGNQVGIGILVGKVNQVFESANL